MRFGDLIASRASCLCDKTAVIYNDKEYSYAEIDANANSVAAFLRANGIGVGNHVVYIAYNSEMYFEILTACSRIGAVFTPISWRMCAESIIELVDATDAKVLFVSKSFLEQLETLKHSISGERKIIVIDDVDEDNAAYSGCLAYPNEEISSADRSGEGCLMQIYTSGTTSIPKGQCFPIMQYAAMLSVISPISVKRATACICAFFRFFMRLHRERLPL